MLECTGSARRPRRLRERLREQSRTTTTSRSSSTRTRSCRGRASRPTSGARARSRDPLRIDGHRALVTGTARKVGGPDPRCTRSTTTPDEHHVVDGIHKRLRNHLVLRYDGTVVPLTCDPAFFYKLDVTKTDITGG